MLLTAVIPTRNRPDDLCKALASVVEQSRPPDEIIVVDQSPGDEAFRQVKALLTDGQHKGLVYIHDPDITGLVHAKQVAASRARGDLVCFLEDDVVLERDYLAEIESGFLRQPEMLGCCGVVTNPPRQPRGYAFLFHLFHRGIFRDPRVGLYGSFERDSGHALVQSDAISGGLSAWRREVFRQVPFDVANGFFMLEDIEFSTRVVAHYGSRLFINPNARLAHNTSPLNRERLGPRQHRKLTEYLIFYKKRRSRPGARIALLWLLLGLFIEAGVQSVSARTFGPLRGYFSGLAAGMAWRLRS